MSAVTWPLDQRLIREINSLNRDVVINPDAFPGIVVGDLLEISRPPSDQTSIPPRHVHHHTSNQHLSPWNLSSATVDRNKKLVVQVTSVDDEQVAKQQQLQISIAKDIASLFELQPRTTVLVRKVHPHYISLGLSIVEAEFVEVSFRDQYIGRSDMWKLKMNLNNTCIYVGKKVTSLGVRAQVKELVVNGRSVPCALVTENTRTIYRSESAKYFIFIQMSKEMWEFDEDGELYFEKCVHGFLPELFSSWKRIGTNHVVSIVLFARIFFDEQQSEQMADDPDEMPLSRDSSNRLYRDFYRVVVDWETRTDWSQVLVPLKKEFIQFNKYVLQRHGEDGSMILSGMNSPASEGNVLEAVNLALNPFDKHYIDRDLLRTGLSIVIVTPSPGIFEVEKTLARLTTQRMIDNGIGCDVVSLSKPPLYAVPLLQFVAKDRVVREAAGFNQGSVGELEPKGDVWDPLFYDDPVTDGAERIFFTIPGWVEISFYNRSFGSQNSNNEKFLVRCKMNDQSLRMETGTALIMDYLEPGHYMEPVDDPELENYGIDSFPYDKYDSEVFAPINKLDAWRNFLEEGRFRSLSQAESDGNPVGSAGTGHNPRLSAGGNEAVRSYEDKTGESARLEYYRGSEREDQGVYSTSAQMPIRIRPGTMVRGQDSGGRESANHRNSLTGYDGFKPGTSPISGDHSRHRVSPGMPLMLPPRSSHNLRQNYINPCNPSKNVVKVSSSTRRWQHVYPSLTAQPFKNEMVTKWKSITTPACLPLTTDFVPSSEEAHLYSESTYTVTPADDAIYQDDTRSETQRVVSLLSELIAQRLQQGFQLIVASDGAPKMPSDWGQTTDDVISPSNAASSTVSKFWSGRAMPNRTSTKAQYFLSLDAMPHSKMLNPSNENLDEEELRLAGFYRFIELFERSRYLRPEEKSEPDRRRALQKRYGGSSLNIQLTTLSTSAYVRDEWFKVPLRQLTQADRRGSNDSNIAQAIPASSLGVSTSAFQDGLTRQTPPAHVAQAMQHPATGLMTKDRRWHFILYEGVFVGSDCVDWIMSNVSDVETREDAVEFGNELLASGVIEHATKRHRFLDGHYFYRVGKEFRIGRTAAAEQP
ncbi:vacuolar membrane-associated protein iml1, partial [Irineochytrium annulatum]